MEITCYSYLTSIKLLIIKHTAYMYLFTNFLQRWQPGNSQMTILQNHPSSFYCCLNKPVPWIKTLNWKLNELVYLTSKFKVTIIFYSSMRVKVSSAILSMNNTSRYRHHVHLQIHLLYFSHLLPLQSFLLLLDLVLGQERQYHNLIDQHLKINQNWSDKHLISPLLYVVMQYIFVYIYI